MKGDFVLEKNTSGLTKGMASQPTCENCTEPYIGMPIYLDDSFFNFRGDEIGMECPLEEDLQEYMDDYFDDEDEIMMPNNGGSMPNNGGSMPNNGGSMPNNGNNQPNMGNGRDVTCLEDWPIAMAYVPWQMWDQVYDMEKGFSVGTIFPDLNLPFLGGASK